MQECIGDVCFPVIEDGKRIIEVNIDENKHPECAELVRDIITNTKDSVRFNLKKAELNKPKSKDQEITDLEKRLKELKA